MTRSPLRASSPVVSVSIISCLLAWRRLIGLGNKGWKFGLARLVSPSNAGMSDAVPDVALSLIIEPFSIIASASLSKVLKPNGSSISQSLLAFICLSLDIICSFFLAAVFLPPVFSVLAFLTRGVS